jgi:hypothetical protein
MYLHSMTVALINVMLLPLSLLSRPLLHQHEQDDVKGKYGAHVTDDL